MSLATATEKLIKQPQEKRKYSFSFLNLLDDNEVVNEIKSITSEIRGSSVASDLSITGTGINSSITTIDDVDYRSGCLVELWIASGTDQNTYRIEVLVGTNAGSILEGDGLLSVKDT